MVRDGKGKELSPGDQNGQLGEWWCCLLGYGKGGGSESFNRVESQVQFYEHGTKMCVRTLAGNTCNWLGKQVVN